MVRRKASETPFAFYCWFIQVLIVLTMAALVIWSITKPQNPKFTITTFHIRNNSVQFDLEITNPNNGRTICYLEIDLKLYDDHGGVVGNKSLGSFCQGQKKTVTEEVVIDADRNFRAGNGGGGAGLRVVVETLVKYHILNWKTKYYHMGFEGFVRSDNISENIYLHKIA